MYQTSKTHAACYLNHGSSYGAGGVGKVYQSNARPGVWYIITWYKIGNSYYQFDQNRCPSGTSLAYIKNNDDWIDYKYLRGTEFHIT